MTTLELLIFLKCEYCKYLKCILQFTEVVLYLNFFCALG